MRTALLALVLSALVFFVSSATAQTNKSGSFPHTCEGSRNSTPVAASSGSVTMHPGGSPTGTPQHWATTPAPSSSNRDREGHSSGDSHHRRHPSGRPYTYGYGVDYSPQTEQNSLQTQGYVAEDTRLEKDREEDRRRERELERQLADQRAADAAVASLHSPSAASSAHELLPTVLIYKDHRQTEVRNYAITGNVIYEFAPNGTRKIALSDLDIPATVAANNELGMEFSVPGSSPANAPQQ